MPKVKLKCRIYHNGWKEPGEEFEVNDASIAGFVEAGTEFVIVPVPAVKKAEPKAAKVEVKPAAPKVEPEQISSLSEDHENG